MAGATEGKRGDEPRAHARTGRCRRRTSLAPARPSGRRSGFRSLFKDKATGGGGSRPAAVAVLVVGRGAGGVYTHTDTHTHLHA